MVQTQTSIWQSNHVRRPNDLLRPFPKWTLPGLEYGEAIIEFRPVVGISVESGRTQAMSGRPVNTLVNHEQTVPPRRDRPRPNADEVEVVLRRPALQHQSPM